MAIDAGSQRNLGGPRLKGRLPGRNWMLPRTESRRLWPRTAAEDALTRFAEPRKIANSSVFEPFRSGAVVRDGLASDLPRGGSSVGRALRSQCRGRGFDSLPLH